MWWLSSVIQLVLVGFCPADAWKPSQPRLLFSHSDLVRNGRVLSLPLVTGDLYSLLADEDNRRLYVAMKDNLLSASLDDITQNPRKLHWPASPDRLEECLLAGKDHELECANFLRVLQPYNHTHLYVCGTGAFNPRCAFIPTNIFLESEHQTLWAEQTESGKGKCPYDPQQRTATAMIDGHLYAGITSDFMSRDSAFFRSLGEGHVIRTEQYDPTWLQDAQFVHISVMSESDNPEDDKVYVFFTERAQEAEGANGKVLYSRVARVCKNDIGGQRSLVNKWSTFQKARMVCSVPGPDGIQTHFDQLQDIFIQHGKDQKNPLIFGLFTTTSDVLNGSAVCVYRMQDIARVFKGNFYHRDGPQYKWAEFTGRVPYPRPGTCPSRTYGNFRSTHEYPDDVIFFSRTHPLMQEMVLPLGTLPLIIKTGVSYKFTRLLVDQVEAVDGKYNVLFIGTDSGLVLKSIHLPKDEDQGQDVILEQLQVFKHKSAVTAMTLSKKRQWLFVGSAEGVAQLALFQCELYGQACPECCLARDPYCTWDGQACSPFIPIARRRNTRQAGDAGNPLNQCIRHGGLKVEAEERFIVVAEGNSTYLECLPKSHHAAVTWFKEVGENSAELLQVKSGDQLVLTDRGILISRAELVHGGVYHCQLEEHGFHWTSVTIRLSVFSHASNLALDSPQPWFQDVMALIHPSNLKQRCRELNHGRRGNRERDRRGERKQGEREEGKSGGGADKRKGRKSRSKVHPAPQRSPRSA
ncbi:sema domain, immunoglobulin domain (Ig), short basic domain, secreted, (semaphorin) 3H isoform X2 [Denticeps clupeoides]|uniref:sema domain, immunoglobulin domain (Ig), short basic domain, secreted, (semaphorin) 3H isoform X2 n=1 Tax=Denticeps clupeoides TaxID=299321 RepID=UPI0010A47B39|nr:semaphorin-3A-like isoform X2 [Denticeps clupeoides]